MADPNPTNTELVKALRQTMQEVYEEAGEDAPELSDEELLQAITDHHEDA